MLGTALQSAFVRFTHHTGRARPEETTERAPRLLGWDRSSHSNRARARRKTGAGSPRLVRIFPLFWTLMHVLDERSPLNGYDAARAIKANAQVFVLLEARDPTLV